MVEERNDHSNGEVRTFADVKERMSNSIQRNKGKLIVTLIVVGVLLLGGIVKLFNYSSTPGFCISFCHEMKPEYRTWKKSVHAEHEVECHSCHYEQGFIGTLKAKWAAQNTVFSHMFGSYLENTLEKAKKDKVFLEVQNIHQQGDRLFYIKTNEHGVKIINTNCKRCHHDVIEKEGEGLVSEARGVRMAHRVHIEEQGLECTDCHINIVHGEEPLKRNLPKMRICFRCHNKDDSEAKLGQTNCQNCHIAQKAMWAGKSGYGVPTVTSEMYGATECIDCHTPENNFKKPQNVEVCLECHEEDIVTQYNKWKDDLKVTRLKLQERMNTVEEKIAYAKKNKKKPEQRASIEEAEKIFLEARENLMVVNRDGSNGVHNNEYALGLLKVSRKKLQDVIKILP